MRRAGCRHLPATASRSTTRSTRWSTRDSRPAVFRVDWANGPLELTLGGETRFGAVDSERYVNNNARTRRADLRRRPDSAYRQSIRRTAISPGPRPEPDPWAASTADGFRSSTRPSAWGPERRDRARRFSAKFSPKFGLLYDRRETVQFYANYSRSAEFPGFIELAQTSSLRADRGADRLDRRSGHARRGRGGGWDVSLYRSNVEHELLQFTCRAGHPGLDLNCRPRRSTRGSRPALTIDLNPWLRPAAGLPVQRLPLPTTMRNTATTACR